MQGQSATKGKGFHPGGASRRRPEGPVACQPMGAQDVICSQGHPVLTIMSSRQAFRASNRFGLGPRPNELRQIGADPRGWLHHQLSPAPRSQPRLSHVAPSHETLGGLLQKFYQLKSLE